MGGIEPIAPAGGRCSYGVRPSRRLHAAALNVPEGEASEEDVDSNSPEEWRRVYERFHGLPVSNYWRPSTCSHQRAKSRSSGVLQTILQTSTGIFSAGYSCLNGGRGRCRRMGVVISLPRPLGTSPDGRAAGAPCLVGRPLLHGISRCARTRNGSMRSSTIILIQPSSR
jgi:hypothetical protein